MNKDSFLGSAGLTLVEVLLSIALLGAFAMPVASMFLVANKVGAYSRFGMEASAIAGRIIEGMGPADLLPPTNPEGVALTQQEYSKYNIDKTVYSVNKTISVELSDNLTGSSGPTPTSSDMYMLTIDTSVSGEISFPGYSIPNMTYIPSVDTPAVFSIVINNSDVIINNSVFIPQNFGFFCVIGSENNLEINLTNSSSTDLTIYTTNVPQDSPMVVNAISDLSEWTEYDNLQYGVFYPTGAVCLAKIKIDVTDISTGKVYETIAEKPAYSFSVSS